MVIDCKCGREINNPVIEEDVGYYVCDRCGDLTEVIKYSEFLRYHSQSHEEFARLFGVTYNLTIPKEYMKFAGKQKCYAFSLENSEGGYGTIHEFPDFMPRSRNRAFYVTNTNREEVWGLPEGIVPIEGDGHTWTVLDYREDRASPKVVFFETDDYQSDVLARTFKDFSEMLIPYEEFFNYDGDIIV